MQSSTTELLLPLGAFLIALFLRLWGRTRRLLWPLSLFAVLIHELCHGLAALVSGGHFDRFQMESDGGVAFTRGGQRWLIIPAGYVGTAIFGAGLLFLTNSVKEPGLVAIGLGVVFALLTLAFSGMGLHKLRIGELIITIIVLAGAALMLTSTDSVEAQWAALVIGVAGLLLFVRFISDEYFFTVSVGILTSAALVLIGYYAQNGYPETARFILNFLAFMVGLNAIYDSWYLFSLIQNPAIAKRVNDASRMSEEIGMPAGCWALVWSLNAIVLLAVAFALTFLFKV